MPQEISKPHWTLIVFGAVLIICGWTIGVFPGLALITIAMVAGISFLVAGVGDAISYFKLRKVQEVSGWSLAYAVIDALIGLAMLLHPLISANFIPWLVGICFVVFGVFQILAAFEVKKLGLSMWGWPVASGVLNLIFGILFFAMPSLLAVLFSVVTVFRGISMIVSGVFSE